jgi:hypothetical protein
MQALAAIRYSQVAKQCRAVEGAAFAQGAQERLLDEVLGLLERTEHPVAVDVSLAVMAPGPFGELGSFAGHWFLSWMV